MKKSIAITLFFIICSNDTFILNGTFFHVYELGLYLQNFGVDVYFITAKNDVDIYSIRYTQILKTTSLLLMEN